MSSSRVVSFDFQVIIESGEGVVERDAGHLPARQSRRGHGAAADDAARCVGGLTAIYVRGVIMFLFIDRLKQGGFMLSLKQMHPPSQGNLYAGRSRYMGSPSGERLGVN